MTKDAIRKHFKKWGYKVSEDLSGKIVISSYGFPVGSWDSLSAAHKHFFNY